MPSSPPAEAPHYNGKTLSPASPKPIYIPEPQNIPVLQNQIDPIFNLVSTHMEGPNTSSASSTNTYPAESRSIAHQRGSTRNEGGFSFTSTLNGGDGSHGTQSGQCQGTVYRQERQDISPNQSTNDGPSVSTSTFDYNPAPAQSKVAYFTQNQSLDHHAEAPLPTSSEYQPTSVAHVNILPTTTDLDAQGTSETAVKVSKEGASADGGNIQALLDNLIASASAAPSAENNASSVAAAATSTVPPVSSPSSVQTPIAAFPTPAGLPPRPPPQDEPTIHPNYTAGQSIRSYHNPPTQPAPGASPSTQPNNSYRPPQNYPPNNGLSPSGMGPPPPASFQQSPSAQQNSPQQQHHDEFGRNIGRPAQSTQAEPPHSQSGPDRDRAYQEFLRDEAIYVSEGTWDRFPQGSRLFIGNLFTEKVSKRHLFDVFSKYGRLAQISMKNAYGFVQFLDPGCSNRAMVAEEGVELGGRKIHLEVSKPQKNTRNAAATAAGDSMRAGYGRRSRSPDYGRGGPMRGGSQRPGASAFDRGQAYNNFERRGRDDYRPMRSPSPRGSRGFENYSARNGGLDRYYGGRRSRSKSPHGRGVRYRSRSPRHGDIEDEASLPMPRRNPVQVPDVQIILVEESDRTFVGYIQQSFRDRGLRCDVLQLQRGVSLQAVVKRQIVEGVQAVVRILRKSQVTGKIPLQLFDRSSGLDNVRFEDYEELDAGIAADIVVRSKNPDMAPPISATQYPSGSAYTQHQSPYGQPPQHVPPQQIPPQPLPTQQPHFTNADPNLANAIASLDAATLQKLLSSMNHNQPSVQQPQAPQQGQPPQDLAALFNSVAGQTPQPPQAQQGYQPPPPPNQGYPYQAPPQQQQQYPHPTPPGPVHPYANGQALSQLLNRPPQQSMPSQQGATSYQALPQQQQQQQQQQQHQQQPPPQPQNVRDIMAQLAKYRQ
ncbi:MAG: hypothetical protein Q9163_004644 [Psora crenata]